MKNLSKYFLFALLLCAGATTVSAGTPVDTESATAVEKTDQKQQKKSLLARAWAEAKRQVVDKKYRTRNIVAAVIAAFITIVTAELTLLSAWDKRNGMAPGPDSGRLDGLSAWLWRGTNFPLDLRGRVFGYRRGTPQDNALIQQAHDQIHRYGRELQHRAEQDERMRQIVVDRYSDAAAPGASSQITQLTIPMVQDFLDRIHRAAGEAHTGSQTTQEIADAAMAKAKDRWAAGAQVGFVDSDFQR